MLTFKKAIIVFWALWWLIALWTDVVGGLAHIGWLTASWAPDTNYPFLAKSLAMYHVPSWLVAMLFIGIIVWSLISSGAFVWACLALHQPQYIWLKRANRAFTISLYYWLAFFLSDQLVMNFELEQNHMVQGGFQLLTLLTIYILPNKD